MMKQSTTYTQENKMKNPTEIEEYKVKACNDIHYWHEYHLELHQLVDDQCDEMQTDYENSLCLHPTKSMSKLNLSEIR